MSIVPINLRMSREYYSAAAYVATSRPQQLNTQLVATRLASAYNSVNLRSVLTQLFPGHPMIPLPPDESFTAAVMLRSLSNDDLVSAFPETGDQFSRTMSQVVFQAIPALTSAEVSAALPVTVADMEAAGTAISDGEVVRADTARGALRRVIAGMSRRQVGTANPGAPPPPEGYNLFQQNVTNYIQNVSSDAAGRADAAAVAMAAGTAASAAATANAATTLAMGVADSARLASDASMARDLSLAQDLQSVKAAAQQALDQSRALTESARNDLHMMYDQMKLLTRSMEEMRTERAAEKEKAALPDRGRPVGSQLPTFGGGSGAASTPMRSRSRLGESREGDPLYEGTGEQTESRYRALARDGVRGGGSGAVSGGPSLVTPLFGSVDHWYPDLILSAAGSPEFRTLLQALSQDIQKHIVYPLDRHMLQMLMDMVIATQNAVVAAPDGSRQVAGDLLEQQIYVLLAGARTALEYVEFNGDSKNRTHPRFLTISYRALLGLPKWTEPAIRRTFTDCRRDAGIARDKVEKHPRRGRDPKRTRTGRGDSKRRPPGSESGAAAAAAPPSKRGDSSGRSSSGRSSRSASSTR